MTEDPYKVLGVSRDATDEQIKKAYRRLAMQYHPDRNPGDPEAAKKMQRINAAYEAIKNPDKAQSAGQGYSYGYGYDPYGSRQSQRQSADQGDDGYRQAAYQYIRFGRYREALNVLSQIKTRDAQWYYLSALANDGLGNQVTALEHIRRAVSMDPGNEVYLATLEQIENGGVRYTRQRRSRGGFAAGISPFAALCLCLTCSRYFPFCC